MRDRFRGGLGDRILKYCGNLKYCGLASATRQASFDLSVRAGLPGRSTVPLSEHEQRLLDQIERALYAEDPKFASSYRATDLRKHYSRRIVRCAVLFVLGVLLLMAGVISKQIAVGVLGFIVMLIALVFGITSWQRLTGNREGGTRPRRPTAPKPRVSPKQRLEDRWRRRWEERGR